MKDLIREIIVKSMLLSALRIAPQFTIDWCWFVVAEDVVKGTAQKALSTWGASLQRAKERHGQHQTGTVANGSAGSETEATDREARQAVEGQKGEAEA